MYLDLGPHLRWYLRERVDLGGRERRRRDLRLELALLLLLEVLLLLLLELLELLLLRLGESGGREGAILLLLRRGEVGGGLEDGSLDFGEGRRRGARARSGRIHVGEVLLKVLVRQTTEDGLAYWLGLGWRDERRVLGRLRAGDCWRGKRDRGWRVHPLLLVRGRSVCCSYPLRCGG